MSKGLAKAQGRFSETEIDDEIVVMNLDNGEFFSLTGTAREIWLLLDGTRDRSALLADLAKSFNKEPAEISADVEAFLGQLARAGLVLGA